MKKISLLVAVFFTLGVFVPSAVHAQCTPAHLTTPTTTKHAKSQPIPVTNAPAPASADTARATTATPPPPSENQIALALAYTAKTQTMVLAQDTELKLLTAKYNDGHLAIEKQEADTHEFTAHSDADLGDRLVTVEELNQVAQAEYLKQHGKAEGRFATAAVLDSTLGNFLRAGGQVAGSFLGKTEIGAQTTSTAVSVIQQQSQTQKAKSAASSSSAAASQADAAASASAAAQPQP